MCKKILIKRESIHGLKKSNNPCHIIYVGTLPELSTPYLHSLVLVHNSYITYDGKNGWTYYYWLTDCNNFSNDCPHRPLSCNDCEIQERQNSPSYFQISLNNSYDRLYYCLLQLLVILFATCNQRLYLHFVYLWRQCALLNSQENQYSRLKKSLRKMISVFRHEIKCITKQLSDNVDCTRIFCIINNVLLQSSWTL